MSPFQWADEPRLPGEAAATLARGPRAVGWLPGVVSVGVVTTAALLAGAGFVLGLLVGLAAGGGA